jgi:NADPH:quinone reductase-like Zn-dependent oxidoreductase
MRAIVMSHHGGPDVLAVRELPDPVPDERRDLELASSMPASGTVSRPNEAELGLETLQERIAE